MHESRMSTSSTRTGTPPPIRLSEFAICLSLSELAVAHARRLAAASSEPDLSRKSMVTSTTLKVADISGAADNSERSVCSALVLSAVTVIRAPSPLAADDRVEGGGGNPKHGCEGSRMSGVDATSAATGHVAPIVHTSTRRTSTRSAAQAERRSVCAGARAECVYTVEPSN